MAAANYVWVQGKCVDISGHERWHPGGDVIQQFAGTDCTTVFLATHPEHVRTKWLKARTVPNDKAPPAPTSGNPALRNAYAELHCKFRERGWLSPSLVPLLKNLSVFSFFVALIFALPGPLHPVLLGWLIGMALHSVAFPVHDSLHGGIFQSKSTAREACRLFGDVLFGVVGNHWDFEHVAHHALANDIDHDLQQRNAPIIIVDWKQMTVKVERVEVAPSVKEWLLRINHWFWFPAAIWGGRFVLQGISVAWCFERIKTRYTHVLGLLGHYTWLVLTIRARSAPMLGYGPWIAGLVAVIVAGSLHVQLLVNHASRPMHSTSERLHRDADWVEAQAHSTADILCSPAVDWFHGGLQFQIAHHLFPRLRSDRLREATPEVYRMLNDAGLDVHLCHGLAGGVAAVTRQLVTACEAAGLQTWPPSLGLPPTRERGEREPRPVASNANAKAKATRTGATAETLLHLPIRIVVALHLGFLVLLPLFASDAVFLSVFAIEVLLFFIVGVAPPLVSACLAS